MLHHRGRKATTAAMVVILILVTISLLIIGRDHSPAPMVEASAGGREPSAVITLPLDLVSTTTVAPTSTTTTAPVRRSTPTTTPRPKAKPTAPSVVASSGASRWDKLAGCESGGNWAYPPVGKIGYSGGTMTAPATWRSYGGLSFAPAAYLATKAEQVIVNERVLAANGWHAWPGCSRKFGWL